jgi:hypothetical protein
MNLRYVLTNRQSMPRMGMCVDSTRGSYRRSSTQRTSKLKRLERSRYAPNLDNFPPLPPSRFRGRLGLDLSSTCYLNCICGVPPDL